MPSVSKWRHDGVPHARLKYLAEVGKDKLQGIDLRAACSNKRGPGAVVKGGGHA
ncbi:hypothetical protein [Comamonas kerstersii]|nr:hypothetical protein [Comamonas kerstersii]